MTDSRTRLDKALAHLHLEWGDQEVEVALVQLHRRRRQRRLVAQAITATSAALLVVGVTYWLVGGQRVDEGPTQTKITEELPRPAAVAPATQPASVRGHGLALADGSSWRLLSTSSKLALRHLSARHVRVALEQGAARFQLAQRPERRFEVVVGEVTLDATGSDFAVTRDERDGRARVQVYEGRVTAGWSGGEAILFAGDVRAFPPMAARPTRGVATKSRRVSRWRKLARAGRYAEAYRHLRADKRRGSKGVVRDEAKDLFLAADAARLAGDPRGALPYLASIVKRHRRDPRAGLAAFTMGRLLLDLGRPRKAARRFAEAQRLLRNGPLKEDALAREVEAWGRAGDKGRAQRQARRYLERHPTGRRAAAVRAFAGTDLPRSR